MWKHGPKQENKKKVIPLKGTAQEDPQAKIEYEEDPTQENPREKQKAWQAPKAFYRVAVLLVVVILGLTVWINRDNLTPENIWNWVKIQVMGTGDGDGYPVTITGSSVSEGNFLARDGNAVVLSDTALTFLGPSGQELASLRHSLNQPILKSVQGKYLLLNQGGTGYMVVSGMETVLDKSTSQDILTGAIAPNGRFALATQGQDGATDLTVYLSTGEKQFTYQFARDYILSLALNADGTYGMVCTVRSEGGELVSKVSVFDFNHPDPIAQYETTNNLLLGASWGDNGVLYAVGDTGLLRARSTDYAFTEYSYEGRRPTAFLLDGSQVYISVSSYEHAGPSTLLVFRNMEDPVEIPAEERIVSLSVYGGSLGALMDQQLVVFDSTTGQELTRADAGSDAKSIALTSESAAYVLGVSEVRTLQLN